MKVANVPIDGVGLSFMVQILFTQTGQDLQIHAQEI
jgi:hypothetical protein